MTPGNEALVKDVKALMRESMHVKRAAGWADITSQLVHALEESETARERLEERLSALEARLGAHNRNHNITPPPPEAAHAR